MPKQDQDIVHPGDIIQAVEAGPLQGHLLVVHQVQRWGVGAVMRWNDAGIDGENYYRLKRKQFVVIGGAHILPSDVADARRASIATAAEVERERLNDL